MAITISIIAILISIVSAFKVSSCETARALMEETMFQNQQEIWKLKTDLKNKPRRGRPRKKEAPRPHSVDTNFNGE